MNIDKAFVELRAAFPRVRWVLRPTCVSAYRDDGNLLLLVAPQDDSWIANCATGWVSAQAPNPVSAVRAWLAAQPTAAFYPEPSSGETEEYAGWIAIGSRRDYGLCRDFGPGMEWESKQSAADGLDYHCDEARFHRFVIRVPAPVDPPVLVGEVSDV